MGTNTPGPHPALEGHRTRIVGDVVEVDVHAGPYACVVVSYPAGSSDPAEATVLVGNDDTIVVDTVEGLRAYAADLVAAADIAEAWWARLLNGA